VNIVPSGSTIALNPDVYGVPAGSPLQAQVGDLVSWNNQTEVDEQIVVSGETLDVRPWSSTTAYQIQNPTNQPRPYTITYTCTPKQGTAVNGTINVTA
jgi:plastocyanin